VAAAAAFSGLHACWEYLQFGPAHRAAGSKGKAIPFGDIAILSSVLSFLGACLYAQTKPYRAAAFALGAVLGGYASLASHTRGALIFLPSALAAIIAFLIQSYPAYRRAIMAAGLAASLAGVALALQMDQIRGRFDEGISQIRGYGQGQVVTAGNSMGERMEMWRTALAAFRENPLLGIGVGQLNGYFVAAARRGDLSPVIAEFDQGSGHTHAHSDYVDALATRGLVGLVSLLLLYLVPLGIFTRAAVRAERPEGRATAYAGIVAILGYMHFSLTDSVLLSRITAGFFVLLIAWLAALVLAGGRQPPVPPGPAPSPQTASGHA
jgi:O-antigen ligase